MTRKEVKAQSEANVKSESKEANVKKELSKGFVVKPYHEYIAIDGNMPWKGQVFPSKKLINDQRVDLNKVEVKGPKGREVSFPDFVFEALKELEAQENPGLISKNDLQNLFVRKMKELHPEAAAAIISRYPEGAKGNASVRHQMAEFFERGGKGYDKNPGWFCLFSSVSDGGRRFAIPIKKGEAAKNDDKGLINSGPRTMGSKKTSETEANLGTIAQLSKALAEAILAGDQEYALKLSATIEQYSNPVPKEEVKKEAK